MMRGLVQEQPLLISSLIEHAAKFHGDREIISRTAEGPIHRTNYATIARRAKKLANCLVRLGVKPGQCVGTLAWNGYRHMELYYGISGLGAVLHTINPRLFPEQIEYIANHAEDQYIFFDITFAPLVERLAPTLKNVRAFIAMTDRANIPECQIPNLLCYEDLLAAEGDHFEWPTFDENTASSLCYTSGTTGNPKGVLYSHRSTILHSFLVCMCDGLGLSEADCMMLNVPMFHVNAWGAPYAGAMCGAKLVLPGPALDGKSVYDLLHLEGVTTSLGVPTIWMGLFNHVDEAKLSPKKDLVLKRVIIGGSAASRSMIERFKNDFNTEVLHVWGMTEMSPLGTIGLLLKKHEQATDEQKMAAKVKQGRAIYGVDIKVVDEDNIELPHDGQSAGHLKVRGPWVTSGYFKGEGGQILDEEGYFDTGDISTLDADGYMQITDRSKDIIKSGGEWISSIDLENAAVGHPAVAEAAVIGLAHQKWTERPFLVVVVKIGQKLTKEELQTYLGDKVAKWWLPDDIVFVDQLPHTATGKLQKMRLREMFRDYKLPTDV